VSAEASSQLKVANPYPGLRPFREDEAYLFFGREKHTKQLREQLAKNKFLAVVGVSGSGKSSLVRAGLIASLRSGGNGAIAEQWRIAELRPGRNPLLHLAGALARALRTERQALFRDLPSQSVDAAIEGDQAFILATLQRGPLGLVELLKETPLPDDYRLVVFVDQFEEIFRFRQEDAGATNNGQRTRQARIDASEAFVALLLETAKRARSVDVLLTMRSDYLGDCAVFPGLPEAIDSSQYLTPRLTRQQRAASIVAPARVCGGEIDPALTNRLLNETGPESDQLPLLQHCLMRMWVLASERSGGDPGQPITLRIADYEAKEVGTLKRCLSNHANAVLAKLTSETQQQLAELLFRALAAQTSGRQDIRREVTFGHVLRLAAKTGEAAPALVGELTQVIDAFRAPDCSFIVTSEDQAELKAGTSLDISHEALIRNWDKLKRWVAAEAKSLEMYRWLEQTARRWKDGNAALWDTPNLEFAMEWKEKGHPSARWAARYGGDFLLAMEFLNKSYEYKTLRDHRQETERLAEEQKLREEAERERLRATQERNRAEREKKLRKRERYAIGLFLLGLFLVVGIGWKYYQDLTEAKKRSAERSDKFLERAQGINRSTDPIKDAKELWNLSVALHYDIHNVPAARRTCELLYGKNWCVPMISNLHHSSISSNAVLCAATLGPKGSQAKIFAVAEDGGLLVWREGKPALVREKDLFTADHQSGTFETRVPTPTAAFFSDDGKWLLVIPPDATPVASADTSAGAIKPSKPQEEPLEAEIWRWSPALDSYEGVQQHVKLNGRNSLRTVAWSSDGSIFGVASYVSGWGKSFCQLFKREGSGYVPISDVSDRLTTNKVVALCFDFHNRWLATASYDGSKGMVELWDPVSFAPAGVAPGAKTAFPVDGRPATIGSGPGENELTLTVTGGPIQVLDLTSGELKPIYLPTKRDQYARIIFGPEHSGRRLEDIILYKRIIAAENANTPGSEPICFQGTVATAKFSDDGKKVMTLSGDNLNALDTIRIWGASLPEPPDPDKLQFTGENPPAWLADLAELVSGLETPFSYERATSSSRDQISKYSVKDVKDEYKKIWQRFEPILNDL
jgi:WD40 repeat protein/energy-coupling factor transporter ATP-binding protein EcfA2